MFLNKKIDLPILSLPLITCQVIEIREFDEASLFLHILWEYFQMFTRMFNSVLIGARRILGRGWHTVGTLKYTGILTDNDY